MFKKRESRERDNGAKGERKSFGRKKICRFCADRELSVDYKEPAILWPFVTERGKIIPRRISGACAFHQRTITTAVKQARQLALLPYTDTLSE